jgi:hypothetical protein
MSRADAIKAKDEKTTYVILLKLANQSMTNTTNSSNSDIAVEYTVLPHDRQSRHLWAQLPGFRCKAPSLSDQVYRRTQSWANRC